MTTQELNSGLDKLLKSFIKKEGAVDSGSLLKSVKFNTTYINSDLNISIKANDYIQYVENGDLLKDFFELGSVEDLIAEFIASKIGL